MARVTVGTPVQRGVQYDAEGACRFGFFPGGRGRMTVSGAGSTAVNGTYVYDGTNNGHPSYTYGIYHLSSIAGAPDVWMFYYGTPESPGSMYQCESSADYPDGLTYVPDGDGVADGPTVAAGGYDWIPIASTFVMKETAEGVETEDHEGVIDNYATRNHKLVCSGDFKIRPNSSLPNKGDLVYTADHDETTWVVTGDPEVKSFSPTTGVPMIVTLELMTFEDL